ncbi:MAG: hypothetical protein WCB48_14335 [Casimicrobiaceae bacterium]
MTSPAHVNLGSGAIAEIPGGSKATHRASLAEESRKLLRESHGPGAPDRAKPQTAREKHGPGTPGQDCAN